MERIGPLDKNVIINEKNCLDFFCLHYTHGGLLCLSLAVIVPSISPEYSPPRFSLSDIKATFFIVFFLFTTIVVANEGLG